MLRRFGVLNWFLAVALLKLTGTSLVLKIELVTDNMFLATFMLHYQILLQVSQMRELFPLLPASFKVLSGLAIHTWEVKYLSIVTVVRPRSASRFFNARQDILVTPQRFFCNFTLYLPNMSAPKITDGTFCWYWLNLLVLQHVLYNVYLAEKKSITLSSFSFLSL